MKILIGMLVHNEEDVISNTLSSLFKQDIFTSNQFEVEIIVLANGCWDKTVAVAKSNLANFALKNPILYKVIDKEEPGKIAAWNDLVHQHSNGDEKYIIFMDGDIIIQEPNNLSTLVESLENNSKALISTDQPIKDIALEKSKSLRSKLSCSFSKITQKGSSQLCGQLYCARADFIRKIFIPPEILIDDTYLKFMACTGGLKHPVDHEKIVNNYHISHIFEAYTGFQDYFNNQIRQAAGFSLWRIFKEIIKQDLSYSDAIEIVNQKRLQDPFWLKKAMYHYFTNGKKKWFIYQGALGVRFKRLKRLNLLGKLKMLIPTCLAWFIDLAVFIMANQKIKNQHLEDLWPDTKSKKLAALSRPLTNIQN